MAVVIFLVEPFFQAYMFYEPLYIKISALMVLIVVGVITFFIPAHFMGILRIKDIKVHTLGERAK
jgi:hypothetical protein